MAKTKNDKFLFVDGQDSEQKSNKKQQKYTTKSKKKKKKSTHYYGPIEFSFNFISLVVVICIGLYFGGRSFYYYSLQNQKTRETAMTLNGLILSNNKLVKMKPKDYIKMRQVISLREIFKITMCGLLIECFA